MHQCVDIVVDNSHSQDTANAQEKHHRILTVFGQLFPMDPAKHTTLSTPQSCNNKQPSHVAVIGIKAHSLMMFPQLDQKTRALKSTSYNKI